MIGRRRGKGDTAPAILVSATPGRLAPTTDGQRLLSKLGEDEFAALDLGAQQIVAQPETDSTNGVDEPQFGCPQRVRRSVIEPGSTLPELAMAASSAAIFSASAWWAAATRTVSGLHRFVIPGMSYCIYTV